jgi:hypothetical protein
MLCGSDGNNNMLRDVTGVKMRRDSRYDSVINQATSPRLGRALDTRPTITVEAGQLCHVILIKPLSLAAMWE